MKLTGKVALVTGASRGIGAGIAKALAAEGAKVIVNYRSDGEAAYQVVKSIEQSGGTAIAVPGDVASEDDIAALFKASALKFGRVDILINNAGVFRSTPIGAINEMEFRRQFDINVLGLLLATQAATMQFGVEGGSIINVSSLVSRAATPQFAIYNGTKGAVDAITRTLAKELGPRGIRVNSINPGVIATDGAHAEGLTSGEFSGTIIAQTPLGRLGQETDIAPVAAFLASDDARWITGEIIYVAGGM